MNDLVEQLNVGLSGRYRVDGELGQGGMAIVYQAQDLRHERDVAIKVLRPEIATEIGAERFLQEIRIAARLIHPHILPLYASGEVEGLLYYVMPNMKGSSLRDRMDREGQIALADALRIASEVAVALDYAHRQNVVHRDIKPENILFHDGSALVADFGIGKALTVKTGPVTQTGMALGTPTYMSPEQASGERDLDGRSDIYSLGCVFFEMLCGEPPFTGPTSQAIIAKRFLSPVPPVQGDEGSARLRRDGRQSGAGPFGGGSVCHRGRDGRGAEGRRAGHHVRTSGNRRGAPIGRRPAAHQHECRPGKRVLQRRDHRGDHQRAGQAARGAGRLPDLLLRVQGQGNRHPPGRREARGGHPARRQRPKDRQPDPAHGAAGGRVERLPDLVGDLRPAAGGRFRGPGRDLPGHRRRAEGQADGSGGTAGGASYPEHGGLHHVSEGPVLPSQVHRGVDPAGSGVLQAGAGARSPLRPGLRRDRRLLGRYGGRLGAA